MSQQRKAPEDRKVTRAIEDVDAGIVAKVSEKVQVGISAKYRAIVIRFADLDQSVAISPEGAVGLSKEIAKALDKLRRRAS